MSIWLMRPLFCVPPHTWLDTGICENDTLVGFGNSALENAGQKIIHLA